nr:disease resistance protein At4g27190-like [Ziziphus jujuba var. spinosa]
MASLEGIIFEASAYATTFIISNFSTLRNFHRNIKSLHDEIQKLSRQKKDIKENIDIARMEGKSPTARVIGWLERVETIECQVQKILEAGQIDGCILFSKYKLSRRAEKKCNEVKHLINSCSFSMVTANRKYPIKPVERLPAPLLAGHKAEEMLEQLMKFLNDEQITRVAIWGMGGVGKTTLAMNLNNKLECSSMEEPFDVVIWITVSKDLNLRRIQSEIACRLNLELDAEESTERRAYILRNRLSSSKKVLLILDDLWEKIDLNILGTPQGEGQANCKVVLTTRLLDVCREMMTSVDFKVDVLGEEEAWELFAEYAGDVVELENINPLARAIARECSGLPLAIKTMGKSMCRKKMIQLWKNTLHQLKRSTLHSGDIEKEVYRPLKLSYSSLPKIAQWCFLYCSLYPENFSMKVSELIHCWTADGLIDENQTQDESFNNGIALIETLKDSCMLEEGDGLGTVKIHGVLRDVAIWISLNEKESGFFCKPSSGLQVLPEKLQNSFKRVSFMNNNISRLPSRLPGCFSLSVLFLQGNPLEKIPNGFFREVRTLRALNLSRTHITTLPRSVLQLGELRALLLRDCCYLEMLPQLGVLNKLRVLDLQGTRVRELPREMGTLTNLRELNLSHTQHLENIEAGSISGLSSLEILDMSFSAYKWDVKRNGGEGATFDELLSLERLSVLHIRLDTIDCLPLDSAWLIRLKEFNIRISPSRCDSNCLPAKYDEKRVILRGVNLLEIGLEGLYSNASALELVICGGICGLSDIVGKRSLCGMPNLKSLTISNCDSITSLLDWERSLKSTLPNLEHLTLSHLKSLSTMLDGMVQRGCLGRLKTIEVVGCPRLKKLISFALFRLVQNLEEIKVRDCRRMWQIIAAIDSSEMLPKLKIIELRDMASLRSICQRALAWPVLESIEVSNCPKLQQLPLLPCNASTIKEIRGDLRWWNNLKWKGSRDRLSFQQRFQACADTTILAREADGHEYKKIHI